MKPPARDDRPPPVHRSLPEPARKRPGPPLTERSHERVRQDRLTGLLDLQLTAVDAIHIGSGAATVLQLSKGPEIVRALMVVRRGGEEGVPVIPGASLKGAVRSLAEAIAGGCNLNAPCQPPCVTCALFGQADNKASFAARIGFSDALPQDEERALDSIAVAWLPVAYEPRTQTGRRIYGVVRQPRKGEVPYEVVNQGVVFNCDMQITNVTEEELGLALLCLGLDGRFVLRIGGGKFGGLGRVRVALRGMRLRRSYEKALPEVLDAGAAMELAQKAMRAYQPDARGQQVLQIIIETLGGAAG